MAGGVLRVTALGCVFVAATLGAAVLSLDFAPTRRITKHVANRVLASVFDGSIVIGSVDQLSLNGVRIGSASAIDPTGNETIHVTNLVARADVVTLIGRVLGGDELRIRIPFVHVGFADVEVRDGPDGVNTLARTFTPRAVASSGGAPPSAPGRSVKAIFDRIELERGYVHGEIAPGHPLDGDVSRVVASLIAGSDGVALDVQQTGLVERGLLLARTEGTANYHLRVDDVSARMWGSLAGRVGGIELLARGELDGAELKATMSAPRIDPDRLAQFIPGLHPTEPLAARVSVHGPLPRLDFSATVGARGLAPGQMLITADGGIDLSSPLHVDADVVARDVALASLDPSLPALRLSADGKVRLRVDDEVHFMADAHTEPLQFEGVKIPAASVHVAVERGLVSGNVSAEDEAMALSGAFTRGDGGAIAFRAGATVGSLRSLPFLAGAGIDGQAQVRASGTFKDDALDAKVNATATGLRLAKDVSASSASVSGSIKGPLSALQIQTTLSGAGVRAMDYDFERLEATASGPLTSLQVRASLQGADGSDASASGVIEPQNLSASHVKLRVERNGTSISGSVDRVAARPGGLGIEGIRLQGEGVGSLEGSLRVANSDVTGSLKGTDVDLSRLARLAGIPYKMQGIADIDVNIQRTKAGRTGHVMVLLEGGSIPSIPGVSANITTKFEGDKVNASGLVRLIAHSSATTPDELRCEGSIAEVYVNGGDWTLRGPLLRPTTWIGMTGGAKVSINDWSLRCLKRLFPVGLPIEDIDGTLSATFSTSREQGQRVPSIHGLSLRTKRLQIEGVTPKGAESPAWSSTHVDVQVRGDFDAATGKTTGQLTLWDGGFLSDLSVDIDLDVNELLDHPGHRLASLMDSPMQTRLTIPRRSVSSFESLPAPLRSHIPSLSGDVRFDLYADGTLREPFVTARGFGWQIATAGQPSPTGAPGPWAMPVDFEVMSTYDGETASLDGNATHAGRNIATLTAQVSAKLADIFASQPTDKPIPWTGGFLAKLDRLPLGDIPFLADRSVGGFATGVIQVTGLNDKPTLAVDLTLPGLSVGPDLTFDRAALSVDLRRRQAAVRDTGLAKLELVAHNGGRIDASAYGGFTWKDGYIPTIDPESPADVYAHADAFRAAAFEPFLSDIVSKLDGEINGDLRFGFKRFGDGEKGSVVAKLSLKDGVFHLPELGQELRGAEVSITADPSGLVRFEGIRAEGISGAITGEAEAHLDGLRFASATGKFAIAEDQPLPLTFEGIPLGMAYGRLDITARNEELALVMDVNVPNFHLTLPSSTGRSSQPLEDNPNITVSQPLGPPKEAPDGEAQRFVFNVDIGKVRIEGRGIDLTFTSANDAELKAVIDDKVRLSGELDLLRGRFNILGKDFQVERGLVRMRPEAPTNPFVNATARWDAPDGSPIYVDYVGDLQPISADKLRIRGAGRSSGEVLAMLLGEEADTDGGGTAAGTRAIGAGGAYLADQLNAALHGVAPGFSTGIAQTEEGAIKTSVAYQIDENLTARASYQQQTTRVQASPGAAYGVCISDRPGAACTELSVEWRLGRNFSLKGSLGSVGDTTNSSIDFLWKYRY